jgi:meso-butanediol dehydrogenase/(S,S)-butanediol dehydrogenase/diacetyl reductase
MSRFDQQVALVNGAAAGIGKAVAIGLAAEGAAVGAFDVNEQALTATAAEIEAAGGRVLALVGDVRRAADAEHAVASLSSTFGGVDLLANIAGVMRHGTVVTCDEHTWDVVFDTNVKSQYLFAKHAVPEMRKRGGGAIVNVASVLAHASPGASAAYSASKGAVVALTRAMAVDHGPEGIRVNSVTPGNVRTPMFHAAAAGAFPEDPEGAMEQAGRLDPIGRLIEPEDVARLVLFLLSADAAVITGSCHRADGGMLAKLSSSPDAVREALARGGARE